MTTENPNGNEANTEKTETAEKRYTQAEVNEIVARELAKARLDYAGADKYALLKLKADEYDTRAAELDAELEAAQANYMALETEVAHMKHAEELRVMREAISAKTGVPAELLTAETAETCQAMAERLEDFRRHPLKYAHIKDNKAEEERAAKEAERQRRYKATPREQFAEWFNAISAQEGLLPGSRK